MLNKGFLRKVSRFAAANALLDKGATYIVALSGGADSVALLLAMKELGYGIEAAHCNFHLRGEESDRDEAFCSRLCADNGIKLHVTHFDTVGFAKLRKVSIEMAARHLRYSYFANLVDDVGAAAVCVAHHQDDSVETVLMNLIRGTGIHGLVGIRPRNGRVVRPLLCVTRAEIESCLRAAGQDYVTDSTNLVDDVVRNKIRLDVIPMLKRINPSVSDAVARTASRVGEAVKALDAQTDKAVGRLLHVSGGGRVSVPLGALRNESSPELVLFHIMKRYSFNPSQVEQVYGSLASDPGRVFSSPTHQLLIDRDNIVIEPLGGAQVSPMKIPETGVYVVGDDLKLRLETVDCGAGFELSRARDCCYADMSKVKWPLVVRPCATGDRFVPFGMKGSKLVSDYLTDIKMNLFDKRRQLVVADADGRIIWLVNQRPDNRFRITGSTATALRISCSR